MINILRLFLIIIMILSASALSHAETSNITPLKKSERMKEAVSAPQSKDETQAEKGIRDMLLGWTDIPVSIIEVTKDSKNPVWGLTGGTLKGVGKAFPRTVSGIVDTVSFPLRGQNDRKEAVAKPAN